VKGHMLHVRRKWRKIMENKENRGLINKKASEDQWARFGHFSFGALSLFSLSLSLSYSWTLSFFLEHPWRVWHTWILGERRQRKNMKVQEGININNYIIFSCRYRVACMIYSLVLACMAHACGFLVVIYHWHGGFHILTVDCLAFPFRG